MSPFDQPSDAALAFGRHLLHVQVSALTPEDQVALMSPDALVLAHAIRPLSTMELAFQAIEARIQGVFDHPALMACGPLSPSTGDDVFSIVEHHATFFANFDQATLAKALVELDDEELAA